MTYRHLAGALLFFCSVSASLAIELDRPDVEAFIDRMVEEHDYDRNDLLDILGQAESQESIIEKISKPAEKRLTWAEYRPIFITKERINAGVKFWNEYSETLNSISKDTGVPVEIVLGIIGVETYYGRITGGHRVIDALTTLAFDYPPRETFFRRELEEFLLIVREEGLTATDPVGSYAGAMGRPQFMPSSFRAYAVDSTGDGKRDIWTNWADVAGSISNYFLKHGWKTGQEVVSPATLGDAWHGPAPSPANTLKPSDTVSSLSKKGVMFATELAADSDSQLLAYAGADGPEYWVAFHNFFVITRYNRSVMYALAVHQLGREIALELQLDDQ
jgi:membrane-bound lytic murein transglycosylase B